MTEPKTAAIYEGEPKPTTTAAMKARPRRRFPNVFYGALLLVSTLFVMTALAYLTVPVIALKASEDPAAVSDNPATPAIAAWLDRNGPLLLSGQFGVMLALGLVAMASDEWFESRKGVD